VAGQNIAVKVVVTPLLMGGASLAGRRFGHRVGGVAGRTAADLWPGRVLPRDRAGYVVRGRRRDPHIYGPAGAIQVLDGLLLGLLAPAVFFLALALMLRVVGLVAFAIATAAAITAQAISMLVIPRDQQPAVP